MNCNEFLIFLLFANSRKHVLQDIEDSNENNQKLTTKFNGEKREEANMYQK